jgi:hypothetical protein
MTTSTRNHAPARAAPSRDRDDCRHLGDGLKLLSVTGVEAGHASAEGMRTYLTHLANVGRPR